MTGSTLLAWGVHLFTASGAVLALLALREIGRGDFGTATILMLIALAIDSVDGSLARRLRVAERAPRIDGRRLDDVVDYLNYALVPAVFLLELGALLHWSAAAAIVLASAYGFAQRDAKTSDDFFLGWPSYWNVVAIYVWLLDLSPAATTAWVAFFALAVFVPLKYVHPSRLRRFRAATALAGFAWIWALACCVWFPEPAARLRLAEVTLAFPAWYVALSAWLGGWLRGGGR